MKRALAGAKEAVDRHPIWTFLDPPTVKGRLARNAVLFALSLLWALVWGIRALDLVWSLWLASLLVGYTTIVLVPVSAVVRAEGSGERVLAGCFGTFVIGFFTVHFGGFHAGHAVFLNLFFPLIGKDHVGPWVDEFAGRVLGYWPMVVVSAWAMLTTWRKLFHGPRINLTGKDPEPVPEGVEPKVHPQGNPMGGIMILPYKNVVMMHLFIFVFAFMKIGGVEDLATYPVLFAYFFPWRDFFRYWRGEKAKDHQLPCRNDTEASDSLSINWHING